MLFQRSISMDINQVYDTTLSRFKARCQRLGKKKRAFQITVQQLIPLLLRHAAKGSRVECRGVIHQNI